MSKVAKKSLNISGINTIRYFELPASYTGNPGEAHEAWEMIYVEKGLFLDKSESESVILKPGDIVVFGSGYYHRTICDGINSANIFITSFFSKSPIMRKLSGRHFFHATSEQRNLIASALNVAVKTYDINSRGCIPYDNRNRLDEQIFINYIEIIMLQLLESEHRDAEHNEQVFIELKDRCNELISQAIAYLEKNIYSNITLEEVCSHLGYSKCHICKEFKEQTGYTVMSYYSRLKIEEAKRIILETHMSIESISNSLNFESPQYFSKVFKKYTGMTPKYFRNKLFKGSVAGKIY